MVEVGLSDLFVTLLNIFSPDPDSHMCSRYCIVYTIVSTICTNIHLSSAKYRYSVFPSVCLYIYLFGKKMYIVHGYVFRTEILGVAYTE
jgi:hypothetical protein